MPTLPRYDRRRHERLARAECLDDLRVRDVPLHLAVDGAGGKPEPGPLSRPLPYGSEDPARAARFAPDSAVAGKGKLTLVRRYSARRGSARHRYGFFTSA